MKQFRFGFGLSDGMQVKNIPPRGQVDESQKQEMNVPTLHFLHDFTQANSIPREQVLQEEIVPEELYIPVIQYRDTPSSGNDLKSKSMESKPVPENDPSNLSNESNESSDNHQTDPTSQSTQESQINNPVQPNQVPIPHIESTQSAQSTSVDLSNSDLIPGKYEGGKKIWEASKDLAKYIYECIQSKKSPLLESDKLSILELGCGHALPISIFAFYKSKQLERLDFQDFNEDVLRNITQRNVQLWDDALEDFSLSLKNVPIHYWGGDWGSLLQEMPAKTYDLILAAETLYNEESFAKQWELMKHVLKPTGRIWIASKRYYYGVGGGTFAFSDLLKQEANVHTIMDICDGSSNAREILEIELKTNQE